MNNKHNDYIKKGIYDHLFKLYLKSYFKKTPTTKLKIQSIDSSFIPNKFGSNDTVKRNKYYNNKTGIKVSSIVDIYGIPTGIHVDPANKHDCRKVAFALRSNAKDNSYEHLGW